MSTVSFLGYEVSNRGAKGDAAAAMNWLAADRKGCVVSTINPHSTMVACENPKLAQALHEADILLPDGIGVVLAGRILGLPLTERVTGYDFFSAFSEAAQAKGGISYYFIGSSEAVLQKIVARMAADYPAIRVAGTLSPPFKPEFSEEDNAAMCEKINAAKPDVLWVGMTAPKQEIWILQNRHRLNICFASAIGAVFDFYAGTKARAPEWIQKSGCEWLYRFYLEPRRMWGRYVVNNPRFIALIIHEKFCAAQRRKQSR
jgi:N-acetylglucosaminyldiphosphoundecaprenol N-acetyl-beta-D-mannosaminyltransferase